MRKLCVFLDVRLHAAFALVLGSYGPILLFHQTREEAVDALDAFLHGIMLVQELSTPLLAVSAFVLLRHLSRAVGRDVARARLLAALWVGVGLTCLLIVAIFAEQLQAILNNEAYRRLDPDDFISLIEAEGSGLRILDNPESFDGYTWLAMTIREAAFMVLMPVSAVLVMFASNKWSPWFSVPALILVLYAILVGYVLFVAPWSLIVDYDVFTGDRILGELALQLFLLPAGDPVARTVVLAYLVSIIALALRWRQMPHA